MRKMLHLSLGKTSRFGTYIFALAAFLCFSKGWSQTTYTIGTGTNTSTVIPLNCYYGYSYSQNLYYGSEVNAGNGAGVVSKIRFYYSSGNTNNSNNWTVYLGNTSKTDFTSNTDWVPVGQMTQVFSGTVTIPGAAGWMEITLSTPFNYYGGNLVVAVDENTTGYSTGNANWRMSSTTPNRAIYYYDDNNNPNPASPPSAVGRVQGYSHLQLVITPFPSCTGIPAPGTTNTSVTGVCAGSSAPVTLSLQNPYNTFSNISYQWQYFDGTSWVDIAGANSQTYTFSGLTDTTQYQAEVTCGADSTGSSTPVTVNTFPLPNVTVTPSSYALCSGGSGALSAGGALNYVWGPAGGLNTTSGQFVTANPTTSTVYTVTGTDGNNCSASATVTISPISSLPVTVGSNPVQICTAGTPVTLDLTSVIPAGISGSGTWEYQWADTAGNVLQSWSSTSQYNTTPAVDGVYYYELSMRSTSCPTELAPLYTAAITVGFGADVDTLQVNCNYPTGAFYLTNTYGQAAWDTLYTYNFSTAVLDPNEATISANTSITGGRVVVTPSATGNRGAFTLLNPNGVNPQNGTFRMNFLLTADQPINTYGTGGADGIAWSYGDDANYSGTGPAHNGFGTKLRLSFDAANNGTENGNATGIYLVYGWTNATTAYGPGSAQVLAYSPDLNTWKLKTDVPVSITITPDGKFSLTVDGTLIFDEVQLPQAYVNADKSTWKHCFSATTGGDALRQALDNIEIKYSVLNYGIAPTGTMPGTWQNDGNFTGLAPGLYDIWMANPADSNCSRMLGTYEVKDINPVVQLGNDTSICAGDFITLDAGNPGSTYMWNNGYGSNQTVTTSNAGTYMVWVTDTADCQAFGVINVSHAPVPSGVSVFSSHTGLDYFFSVINPQNTTEYSWDFGDGTVINGPSTITHTYATAGQYTITVILTNNDNCGADTLTTTVVNTTGVQEEADLTGIRIYPNPASDIVTIANDQNLSVEGIRIYDISGKMVYNSNGNTIDMKLNVSGWENGMYIVYIEAEAKQSVHRLIVAR